MSFIKLGKPAFVLGNFIRGFISGGLKGSVDEIKETFTDAEITRFSDTAKMLDRCQPWENHLERDAVNEINKALKKNDYSAAREAVTKHATETADPWCIDILKTALLDVCTKCTTLLKESLPDKIVVPKPK